MPTTARDVVTNALTFLAILRGSLGEEPSAADGALGLTFLNLLLSSYNTRLCTVYRIKTETKTLTANDGQYTVGATGDWVIHRPIRILGASVNHYNTSPVNSSPVAVLTREQWSEISSPTAASGLPTAIWLDGAWPNATLHLYPVPEAAHQLEIETEQEWTAMATLDSEFSVPDGWELAIIADLAKTLAAPFSVPWTPDMEATHRKAWVGVTSTRKRPLALNTGADLESVGGYSPTRFDTFA